MSRPLLREAPPPEVVIHQSERFDRILSTLQAHGFRTNQALARDLNVSEMTVRRDLTELSELGQVKRLRGGVRLLGRPGGLALAANDQHELVERLIAESAADLVEDGQTIYIDAGPIAQFLARALRQRNRTCMSLPIQSRSHCA
jgi:DeoR/GlpR family transcriptional regulator of sugar metabolism